MHGLHRRASASFSDLFTGRGSLCGHRVDFVRWVRNDQLRLVSADELTGFAEAAGLRVETLAGGYDLDPLGPGSDRAVLVAVRG